MNLLHGGNIESVQPNGQRCRVSVGLAEELHLYQLCH